MINIHSPRLPSNRKLPYRFINDENNFSQSSSRDVFEISTQYNQARSIFNVSSSFTLIRIDPISLFRIGPPLSRTSQSRGRTYDARQECERTRALPFSVTLFYKIVTARPLARVSFRRSLNCCRDRDAILLRIGRRTTRLLFSKMAETEHRGKDNSGGAIKEAMVKQEKRESVLTNGERGSGDDADSLEEMPLDIGEHYLVRRSATGSDDSWRKYFAIDGHFLPARLRLAPNRASAVLGSDRHVTRSVVAISTVPNRYRSDFAKKPLTVIFSRFFDFRWSASGY